MPDNLTTIAGHCFFTTDRLGDITKSRDHGLFVADTRFFSRYKLLLNGKSPELLQSNLVGIDSAQIYAANSGLDQIPDRTLTLVRRQKLGVSFSDCIEIHNHGTDPVELQVTFEVGADFADIFEVRGFLFDETPIRAVSKTSGQTIEFSSQNSEFKRSTRVSFSRAPHSVTPDRARFDVRLDPDQSWTLDVAVEWTLPKSNSLRPVPLVGARSQKDKQFARWIDDVPRLQTGDLSLRMAYDQAIRDLASLELCLDDGDSILAAGVPWFMAIFGRDSIIASLQTLPITPHFAAGTLRTLAAYQSYGVDDFRDAEPGKIPHEIRFGVLAETDAIPYSRYYGTVDATPLWLILLAETYRWTGDFALVEELLPAAERALRWIDEFGDLDGDGFVEYQCRSRFGLANQGWKDSWNSVRFADGRLAEPPIALVEVQGYVYATKRSMSELYEDLGRPADADNLRNEALELRQRVHEAFWMPTKQCYAMAIDGKKRQVDGIASNQGHLLWAGLPDQEFAEKVVDRLMKPDLFSGWGIRTLATSMTGFNPIGYHLGSVWPHDTALIASGFRRYGRQHEAMMLADGLIEASTWFEHRRLPELFAGWDRSATPFPVDCPVACSPQAWAAGSIIMLLTEIVGLEAGDDIPLTSPAANHRGLARTSVPFRGRSNNIEMSPDGDGSVTIHSET